MNLASIIRHRTPRTSSRWLHLFALTALAVSVVALAGCGNGDDDDTTCPTIGALTVTLDEGQSSDCPGASSADAGGGGTCSTTTDDSICEATISCTGSDPTTGEQVSSSTSLLRQGTSSTYTGGMTATFVAPDGTSTTCSYSVSSD